ncbi:aspartate-semialdehyde dehydrogenase [bacterium]|nr:aspartate-semialdehyde dehydrogenase [bacterium]MBU1983491.1 aspartate-semialdehyde dehydrogenase [bacterium]
MKPIRLAIVGATGLVGRTTLTILEEWNVPLRSLRLFASEGSAGQVLPFAGREVPVEQLDGAPRGIDAAIFATSRTISRRWIPEFRTAGIPVIDHSSEFRMADDVPLLIPEVNAHTLKRHRNLISNPNCSASIIVIPLAALVRIMEMKTVIVDTYQSVSGSGQDALTELNRELEDPLYTPAVYPRVIAHNLFPQIGEFDEHGVCYEEQKVAEELCKMLELPGLHTLVTTVRVPVRIGHSAAVTIECASEVDLPRVEAAFAEMPGMIFERNDYRTPLEIAGRQEVFVGRLRRSPRNPRWIQFWVVGDNSRKGAASNAIQILMELFKE